MSARFHAALLGVHENDAILGTELQYINMLILTFVFLICLVLIRCFMYFYFCLRQNMMILFFLGFCTKNLRQWYLSQLETCLLICVNSPSDLLL